MSKEKNFVSFVIYMYNEAKYIKSYLDDLYTFVDKHFDNFELICVDDASTDNTVEIVKNYCAKKCPITLVEMGCYQGTELSMNAGVDAAIGDFVFQVDSIDINYEMSIMQEVFEQCTRGVDIVMATPSRNRNWKSTLFYKTYNKLSKSNYKLQTNAFCILSRRAINRVKSMSNVLPYRKAVYANCGLSIENYYYKEVNDMVHRENNRYRVGVAIDAFVLYTNAAYRLASFFTFFMLVLTIGISAYALIIRVQGIPIPGWTSMVVILCTSFFGISALISILIKYTELILKTVFLNNKYIVKSVERIVR